MFLKTTPPVSCPDCGERRLVLKYAVTYEYSYVIDGNAPGKCNNNELLPYLYDNREQTASHQYIQCQNCGAKYPCYFDHWVKGIDAEALQKAINAAYLNRGGDETIEYAENVLS